MRTLTSILVTLALLMGLGACLTPAPMVGGQAVIEQSHTTEPWDADTASDRPMVGTPPPCLADGSMGFPCVVYVPCANEDGSGQGGGYPCLWDATTRGNGQGDSVVIMGEPV
jgi:hypothetical protein